MNIEHQPKIVMENQQREIAALDRLQTIQKKWHWLGKGLIGSFIRMNQSSEAADTVFDALIKHIGQDNFTRVFSDQLINEAPDNERLSAWLMKKNISTLCRLHGSGSSKKSNLIFRRLNAGILWQSLDHRIGENNTETLTIQLLNVPPEKLPESLRPQFSGGRQ